jgi:hypothetical protein
MSAVVIPVTGVIRLAADGRLVGEDVLDETADKEE